MGRSVEFTARSPSPRERPIAREATAPHLALFRVVRYMPREMRIAEFLKPDAVVEELKSTSKADILRELSAALARSNPSVSSQRLATVLEERERVNSTGVGEGVAIPHGKLPELSTLTASFGVSHTGIDFDAHDKKPTFLFFALVAPENSAGLHLKALARISRLFRNASFRESILAARGAQEIYALILQEDAKA